MPDQEASNAAVCPPASIRFVRRDYWDEGFRHRPFCCLLHDPDYDINMGQAHEWLAKLLDAAGAQDGDEVEIVVRRTNSRPFGDRTWRWTRPHTYEPVEGSALLAERKAVGKAGAR